VRDANCDRKLAMDLHRFFARHPKMESAVRQLLAPGLSSAWAMRFLIRFKGGKIPRFSLGPPGRQLGCYIPWDMEWQQLNYGQGEGEVEVAGCGWGFYFEQPEAGEMCVVLHSGEIDPDSAMRFVRGVAEKLAGDKSGFDIVLRGDTRLVKQSDHTVY
jgi:hypothetical protein